MTFHEPILLVAAVVLTGVAVTLYILAQRRRATVWAATGFQAPSSRSARLRRHAPSVLLLLALPLLLVGLARPEAEISVPRVSGTVLLALDVSNSMGAKDVKPSRLAAAQQTATQFIDDQPDSVDIGVLLFGPTALLTQAPTDDHRAATAAVARASISGGTSLGQAILVGLSTITGQQVSLPEDGKPAPNLGYWPSGTIVVFSDGQETGGPDVTAAAELAAAAGVRIQTVGVGTTGGDTVEVDGYQLATALDEPLLTSIAQVSGGQYHRGQDPASLAESAGAIDLRLTSRPEQLELTAPVAGTALLLLALAGMLGLAWHGRIV